LTSKELYDAFRQQNNLWYYRCDTFIIKFIPWVVFVW
jgi:hypothetical protein